MSLDFPDMGRPQECDLVDPFFWIRFIGGMLFILSPGWLGEHWKPSIARWHIRIGLTCASIVFIEGIYYWFFGQSATIRFYYPAADTISTIGWGLFALWSWKQM